MPIPNQRVSAYFGPGATEIMAQLMHQIPPWVRASEADGLTCYYDFCGSVVSATAAPPVDALQAVPFWSGSGGIISELAFNVTVGGGAGSKARCGLYAGDEDLLIPTSLIVDGGEFDTTTATLKNTLGVNVQLDRNTLYWLAFICGTAAPTVSSLSSALHLFGRSATFAAQFGRIKVGQGYGALPAQFPGGTALMTSTPAMVCVRWKVYDR